LTTSNNVKTRKIGKKKQEKKRHTMVRVIKKKEKYIKE